MPREEDVEGLVNVFDVVLVFVEDKELRYDLRFWHLCGFVVCLVFLLFFGVFVYCV